MLHVNKNTISVMKLEKNAGDATGAEAVSYAGLRLCFVLRGSAEWQINDRIYTVSAGDIVFLSDRQRRRFVSYGKDGFSLTALSLNRQSFAGTSHFSFFLNCIRERDGMLRSEALSDILNELYAELKQTKKPSYALVSAKLTEFFIKAERLTGFSAESAVKIDKNMLRILDHIDTHITEKVSLSALARMAGFTESSFSRWFAKQNGISFKKYIMGKKVAHAIFLLETTDQKVIDIAFACGFDSISGFYDAFRKVTGTTPNKFTYIV